MTFSLTITPGPQAAVTFTGPQAASPSELLELCEEFLRSASPAVHAELRAFLTAQPHRPDPGLLIDLPGFSTLSLQAGNTSTLIAQPHRGAQRAGSQQRRPAGADQVLYECPGCETRSTDRRCPDCNLFSRRLGPGGHCPHCDEPVLLDDLIEPSPQH